MAMQHILITQTFHAPLASVFATLTDHEQFGKLLKTKITRVQDSTQDNKNGLGSVRRIQLAPGLSFEETVISFAENDLMEYTVSKGSPIKNHKGRLEFSELNGVTKLHYTIDFEPKINLPLWGGILKRAIQGPIESNLKRYAQQLR